MLTQSLIFFLSNLILLNINLNKQKKRNNIENIVKGNTQNIYEKIRGEKFHMIIVELMQGRFN